MNTKKIALAIIILTSITTMSVLPFASAANWETVTTITGSADQTTNTFKITAQEWRLQWSYTPDPQFPNLTFFGVLIYQQGESTYIDSFYVNGSTQTSGTELIHEGMNNYLLEILDANIPSYTITVQQYGDTISSFPNGNSNTVNATNILLVIIVFVILAVIVVVLLLQRRKNHTPTQLPTPPASNSMAMQIQKSTLTFKISKHSPNLKFSPAQF
jgi:hypothetical protein